MKRLFSVSYRWWILISLAFFPLSIVVFLVGIVNALNEWGHPGYSLTFKAKFLDLLTNAYFFIGDFAGWLIGPNTPFTTENTSGLILFIVLAIVQSCFWGYLALFARKFIGRIFEVRRS
ncbi:MAG TPA: hypothetical protein VGZ93_08075 [Candidatus Methylacidiphilales bacterium]|nr:hypothetical protein [Candidatus Methylacidiphilales bacterium]